mmetsp:Transcript_57520/g.106230  ORF Transcript_57520/g.106230 Transcript_57520/m.106230 type:complete len:525 (-) Transcript_57520:169-1743(-)
MWSKLDSARLVELLPSCLAWAPESLPQDKSDPAKAEKGDEGAWYLFRSADYVADKHYCGGLYGVAHYPEQACGDAFGPLAIDRVLSFCRIIDECVSEKGKVAIASTAGDTKEAANLAVLVGAYLILYKGWSVMQLEQALKSEAMRPFKRCWKDHHNPITNPISLVKVRHCWLGIHMAFQTGMIAKSVLESAENSTRYCELWRRTLLQYDACWFAHDEVIVGADPMTVICDPNKVTCPALLPPPDLREDLEDGPPEDKKEAADASNSTRPSSGDATLSPASGNQGSFPNVNVTSPTRLGSGPTLPIVQSQKLEKLAVGTASTQGRGSLARVPSDSNLSRTPSESAMTANQSVHSACKVYSSSDQGAQDAYPPALDFVSFARAYGISLMVRANKENEPGLKEIGGSYAADQIEAHGIRHFNAPFEDTHGAVPSSVTVKNVIEACSSPGGIIYVHCKGGFGRSVVLACCHLIHVHDVPGAALLGWTRIARPGAITTQNQEEFLIKMKGRADIEKYMNGSTGDCCAIL